MKKSMKNSRITVKERNLLKGAIRRVFSRSEIRRKIIDLSVVQHTDDSRKRVKNWCRCPVCKKFIAKSYMQVDHVIPIIGVDETLDDLSWDTVIDRIWCEENNLMAICVDCHKAKTKEENKQRRKAKKEKKK